MRFRMEKRVAFLVFPDWKKTRRKNGSLDGVSNIGAYMLIDVAERAGRHIGFCSVDTATQNDIVLVSLTSIYDMLAFYREVRLHPDWQKPRKFRVLCGGFGLQNPFPVLDYVDSFWFGRCEDEFINWLDIVDYEHESLMRPDKPKVCRIHQSPELYPHPIRLHNGIASNCDFTEKIMGCPNKCFFCHFSFSRKHIKTSEHYNLKQYSHATQELDMFNLEELDYSCPKTTIGLDGMSERLRYMVNKRIPDQLVFDTIVSMSQKSEVKGEAFYLKLYNITGYESETDEDYRSFVELVRSTIPHLKKRCLLILHSTPLHPSCATPLVYSAVNIHTKLDKERGKVFCCDSKDNSGKLIAMHSRYNESNFSLIESVVVERFTEQYRNLIDLICFNRKFNALKGSEKLSYCMNHYDLTDLLRAYDTTEQVPSWVCESYIGWDKIRMLRNNMLARRERITDKNNGT